MGGAGRGLQAQSQMLMPSACVTGGVAGGRSQQLIRHAPSGSLQLACALGRNSPNRSFSPVAGFLVKQTPLPERSDRLPYTCRRVVEGERGDANGGVGQAAEHLQARCGGGKG